MNIKEIAFILLVMLSISGQLNAQGNAKGPKVEVYYFHPNERCPIDLTIEDNMRKLMRTHFQTQIQSGIIKFQVINTDEKTNAKTVARFDINAQALYVVRHDPTGETKTDLTELAFSKSQSAPERFRSELEDHIRKAMK
jgi:hypothetical protein